MLSTDAVREKMEKIVNHLHEIDDQMHDSENRMDEIWDLVEELQCILEGEESESDP